MLWRVNCLRESGGSVGLVGFDNFVVSELFVGVGGLDNVFVFVVDNREGGEVVFGVELIILVRGDGVVIVFVGVVVGSGSIFGFDDVGVRSGFVGVGVDIEVLGVFGVGFVVVVFEVLDSLLGRGSYYGDNIGGGFGSWSSEDVGGREESGDDGEFYVCG